MSLVLMIVPCYNEADRLNLDYWTSLTATPDTEWLFVNDGSSDDTGSKLDAFVDGRESCEVLHLPRNVGKAEAVRRGLREGMGDESRSIQLLGFLDADAAFCRDDVRRILQVARERVLHEHAFDAVWSSRVMLKGRSIDRRPFRHYVSRTVNTFLELAYRGLPYDTQSGFKVFRATPELARCLAQPFKTRWLFDIEMLIRWKRYRGSEMVIWEEPVMEWRDVAGSKVSGRELARIAQELITLVREGKRAEL